MQYCYSCHRCHDYHHSHANLESKLLSAMANACKRDIGHETSQENCEFETLPNCIETKSPFGCSPSGKVVGIVGANVEFNIEAFGCFVGEVIEISSL